MRFSVAVAVAALASSVSASHVARQAGLPTCAIECISSADLDGCQPTDNGCLCRSQKFVNSSTVCIGEKCQGSDLQAALNAAQQLCAVVGVTLTSTPSNFPSATAPAASGSGSGSGSGSAAASTPTGNAALANGVSTVASIAALGLAALAL